MLTVTCALGIKVPLLGATTVKSPREAVRDQVSVLPPVLVSVIVLDAKTGGLGQFSEKKS